MNILYHDQSVAAGGTGLPLRLWRCVSEEKDKGFLEKDLSFASGTRIFQTATSLAESTRIRDVCPKGVQAEWRIHGSAGYDGGEAEWCSFPYFGAHFLNGCPSVGDGQGVHLCDNRLERERLHSFNRHQVLGEMLELLDVRLVEPVFGVEEDVDAFQPDVEKLLGEHENTSRKVNRRILFSGCDIMVEQFTPFRAPSSPISWGIDKE